MSVLIMNVLRFASAQMAMPFRHSDPCVLIQYAAIPA